MHLLETYALSCGLKIDKPYVYEHYTTVPYEKFISFNRRVYPFFSEVIKLIKPELDKREIRVVQLLATQEIVDNDVCIFDNLSFGQWAYLMKHSMLHFGEDDYLFDIAAYYDIPRVSLFSATYPATFKPYWGSPEKQRILTSTGPNVKPSFSGDQNANFVRMINPEVIAQNIMDLLGIAWKAPYETVYAGHNYRPHHDIIELVPDKDKPVQLNGRVFNICARMDFQADDNFLASVLDHTKASIVANKPLNMKMLHMLRSKIVEIAYIVDENSDVGPAKELAKLNLPYALLTFKKDVATKEKFFEISAVNVVKTPKLEDIPELKSGLKGLSYKSAKRILHGDFECKGKHAYVNKQASKPDEFTACPEEPDDDFMREIEFFFVVRLTDA